MFDSQAQVKIPGYTGHAQSFEVADSRPLNVEKRAHIPGYSGYVPAVASENVYGKTFAMASHASAVGTIVKGTDLSAKDKFVTSSGGEYIHHSHSAHPNVSQTVGVHRPQDTYQKPVPPSEIHKFYGSDPRDGDAVVQQEHFKKNAASFYNDGRDQGPQRQKPPQEMSDAERIFHGVEERPQGMSNFDPIPGYGGTNRRQDADNFFAGTFRVGRDAGKNSLHRINDEKADTLKANSKFPAYKQAQAMRQARGQ